MKALYETPEVERIDFAAMEHMAEVVKDDQGNEGYDPSAEQPDWGN